MLHKHTFGYSICLACFEEINEMNLNKICLSLLINPRRSLIRGPAIIVFNFIQKALEESDRLDWQWQGKRRLWKYTKA